MSTLARSGRPDDEELDTLRARAADLERRIGERSAEMAKAHADLASFRIRYRTEVGLLHEQLDDLERAVAEAELGELARRIERGADDRADSPAASHCEPPARFTSDGVRSLFREVARTIHPDLASDDQARDRRHRLMIEANRAYALGDEERLRWILEAWENSPEAVAGSDLESMRLRLVRRIAQLEEQLHVHASDLAELHDSALWKLKAMVDDAAAQGKDLIGDMVRRLKRDIMVARNRLEAIQWNP